MKMFLTRLGFGSQMVITGDQTQTDLPNNVPSGLPHAVKLMKNLKNISVTEFKNDDIIRHNLVAKIIQAYDKDHSRK
jgi:phosphate starvation-inducible PhoH-like protein